MYDIQNFTLKDMAICSGILRSLGNESDSMEEAAKRVVDYLYENLGNGDTNQKDFVLIRLFKTHSYRELNEEQQAFVRNVLGDGSEYPDMKCLSLLASAGLEPEWNSRKTSKGHKAIPLPSETLVEKFPMIRQLVQQFGLEVNTVLQPDPDVVQDMSQKTYNVFYVPDAKGSQYVPAQEDFVIPYKIHTILGFGGMLPSGNLFAVIMFGKSMLKPSTVEMFKTLALSVKVSLLPFDGGVVFI
jgi:hypothetical protein